MESYESVTRINILRSSAMLAVRASSLVDIIKQVEVEY